MLVDEAVFACPKLHGKNVVDLCRHGGMIVIAS
jgi:hypothetical protein